jgi:hypothetical protein
MLYLTYKQNGSLKAGVFNQTQYTELKRQPGVSNITIHASEIEMRNAINESKGLPLDNRKVLFG